MRLTNRIRDDIVRNAVAKSRIPAAQAELDAKRFALAEDFRVHGLGGPKAAAAAPKLEKRFLESCKKAGIAEPPRDGFLKSCKVDVTAGPERESIPYSADLETYRITPFHRVVVPSDHPLAVRRAQINAERDKLEDEARTLRAKVRAVVNSFSTVKALLDAWPEAAELLPPLETQRPAGLPAIRVEDLNATLGLPTK